MGRRYIEFVASVTDVIPLPLLVLGLLVLGILAGVLWYFFPAWVPRRLPRWRTARLRRPRWWRRPRFAWRFNWRSLLFWRRKRAAPDDGLDALDGIAADELPDVPAQALVSLADRLAAAGRYAEAVRERLRAIVRDLVDRQVIEHRPGWTVSELARAAAYARPAVDPPLHTATALFSDIWYGQRPAVADDDARMRALSADVRAALDERIGALR